MGAQDLRGIADWRQRIAQLVGEHRQELVLALVHLFERLLSLAALGHIEADAHYQLRYTLIDPARAAVYPAQTAGRVTVAIFGLCGPRCIAFVDEILQRVPVARVD